MFVAVPEIDASTLISAFVTLSEVVSIGFIPLVLLRRKEPSSTFAWIFVLLAFPALGIVLFWYLGRDRIRRPVRTRLAVSSAVRQRLDDRLTGSVTIPREVRTSLIDGQPDVERQMDIVREAHHAQVFRLMAQDLAGRLTVERVSDHLSELADRVLDLVDVTLPEDLFRRWQGGRAAGE